MRILRLFPLVFCLFIVVFTTFAQEKKTPINESQTIQKLVDIKRNASNQAINPDKFNIQIFYGKNAQAIEALNKSRKLYPELEAIIVYTNPSYKVLVGNFKTRLEAERNLQLIRKDFDSALLIRPGK